MSFIPRVRIIMRDGEIVVVMIRQGYHPRGAHQKRYRWVRVDYEVQSEP